VQFVYQRRYILYYGDAEAHLNIARRMVDSRTPGYDQVGTVWLPLLHWLLVPFARVDALWVNGLAGAIPSAIAFLLSGTFLYAAANRIFDCPSAALAATGLFALNPNVLYMQSIPMTESVFSACLLGLLYFTVRFAIRRVGRGGGAGSCLVQRRSLGMRAGSAARGGVLLLAANAIGSARRAVFGACRTGTSVCAVPPLVAFRRCALLLPRTLPRATGTPLIQAATIGGSLFYDRTAAQLCAGPCLPDRGCRSPCRAFRRAFAPVAASLPGIFYIWSMRFSGGTLILLVWHLSRTTTAGTVCCHAVVRIGRRRTGRSAAPVALPAVVAIAVAIIP
jgi:hypothetical protein